MVESAEPGDRGPTPAAPGAEALFAELVRREQAGEAVDFDACCARHPELAGALRMLRSIHAAAASGEAAPSWGTSLAAAIGGPLGRMPDRPERVGPYRILRELGEGGMGIVYLAEQSEPVRRHVALKLIKAGMDTREVIARFESERQALALMSHAGIARVYDAGTTPEGRPYFAMEHVAGQPINVHCDRQRLDTRARLELFVQVCGAVQHAHQRAIIHRDLKPSNILVLAEDGKVVPKIIDFGIAKAIDRRLTDATLQTGHGQLVGTPAYMSPEQAAADGIGLDTRTDIYSLGVILFELLAGCLPFEPERLRGAGPAELARLLRDTQPPRPSTRISRHGDRAAEIAQQRRVDPASLARLLRGDLDWIVLKAIEKEPGRRYASASELAADIERYLRHEPVLASPPSTSYRLRKYVRRHRGPVLAASAVFVALTAGLIASLVLYLRAERSAGEAREKTTLVEQREATARRNLYFAHIRLVPEALADGNLWRALDLLEMHIPKPGEEDLRGFEWYHLWSACHGERLACRGHEAEVTGVALAPDGAWLVSSSLDSTVKLWDASSGKEVLTLRAERQPLHSLAVSADGRTIAAGDSRGEVHVWDAVSGRRLDRLRAGVTPVVGLAFDDKGALGSACEDGTIKLWHIVLREERWTKKMEKSGTAALALSRDGKLLAACTGDVFVFDGETGRLRLQLHAHGERFDYAAFAPDAGTLAAASFERSIQIWDTATGAEKRTLRGHSGAVQALAYSGDGATLISGSVDGTVRLWDPESGRTRRVLRAHSLAIRSLAVSPAGGEIASGSTDGTIKLWDAGKTPGQRVLEQGYVANCVAYSPDGTTLALGSNDMTVRLYDSASLGERRVLKGHRTRVHCVAYSPEGERLASGSGDRAVRLWEARTGAPLHELIGHTGDVRGVAFSPDGRMLASASSDGSVRVWDVASGAARYALGDHGAEVWALGFSRASSLLATAGWDGTLKLWDAEAGALRRTLATGLGRVTRMAFSKDAATLALNTTDGTLRAIDIETGTDRFALKGYYREIVDLAYSPDGRLLATGATDGSGRLWDAGSGEERLTLWAAESRPLGLAFAPDSRGLAVTSRNLDVYLWSSGSEAMVERELQARESERRVQAAVELRNRRETTAAVAAYEDAVRLNPGLADLLLTLAGDALAHASRHDEALPYFRRSLAINPRFARAQTYVLISLGLASAEVAARETASLVAILERAAASGGADHRVLTMLAKLRLRASPARDVPAAERDARQAVERCAGRDAQAMVALAAALAEQRQWRGAMEAAETALRLEPGMPEALEGLRRWEQLSAPDLPTYALLERCLHDEDVLVPLGATWRFLRGKSEPPADWMQASFEDAGWETGTTPVGYGDGDDATVLDDMQGAYASVYLRIRFQVEAPERCYPVARVLADDGFVAYLNGAEICRRRAGGRGEVLAATATATEQAPEPLAPEAISIDRTALRRGENVLAVQGLNRDTASTDLTIGPMLTATLLPSETEDRKVLRRLESAVQGPDAAARLAFLEGLILARAGKWTEARTRLEVAAAAEHEAPEPHLRLAEACTGAENLPAAEAVLRAALNDPRRHDTDRLWETWLPIALGKCGLGPREILDRFPGAAAGSIEVARRIADARLALAQLAASGRVRLPSFESPGRGAGVTEHTFRRGPAGAYLVPLPAGRYRVSLTAAPEPARTADLEVRSYLAQLELPVDDVIAGKLQVEIAPAAVAATAGGAR